MKLHSTVPCLRRCIGCQGYAQQGEACCNSTTPTISTRSDAKNNADDLAEQSGAGRVGGAPDCSFSFLRSYSAALIRKLELSNLAAAGTTPASKPKDLQALVMSRWLIFLYWRLMPTLINIVGAMRMLDLPIRNPPFLVRCAFGNLLQFFTRWISKAIDIGRGLPS